MNNAYYKAWPEELRGQPWILPVQYSYTRMVNRKEIIDFITNSWLSGVVKNVCKQVSEGADTAHVLQHMKYTILGKENFQSTD